jgi:hypothetical protein
VHLAVRENWAIDFSGAGTGRIESIRNHGYQRCTAMQLV